MAEAILFDIAGEIIKKLGSRALQEIGLWWGLKDELEKLKRTMFAIQAVLLDAEEKSAHNNQVKDWLGKLREVAYDVDDLLDDFSTEALHRQVMDGNKVTKEAPPIFHLSSVGSNEEGPTINMNMACCNHIWHRKSEVIKQSTYNYFDWSYRPLTN